MTAVVVALVAAIPATLAALAALLASRKSVRTAEETLDQGKQIHVLVNSNLDKVKAELATANAQIEILLAHLKQRLLPEPESK